MLAFTKTRILRCDLSNLRVFYAQFPYYSFLVPSTSVKGLLCP